ncbi:MAG: TetR/AcrR family transcriptional regulator [Pseudomonadota bacterium]
MPTADANRIIDAMLTLLSDRPYDTVTVHAIAREADVSLATLRAHFASRIAIIAAFAKRVDAQVLAADMSDMADEAPRDRLFDVLMARLDALRPHRDAIAALLRAGRKDPALGMTLATIEGRSQAWMLAAARLSVSGWRGRLAVHGLVASYAKVLRVFVDEDEPGMPKTMAALDKILRELETRHGRFARLFGDAVLEDHDAPSSGPAQRATAPEAEQPAVSDGPTGTELPPETPSSPDADIKPAAPGGPAPDPT